MWLSQYLYHKYATYASCAVFSTRNIWVGMFDLIQHSNCQIIRPGSHGSIPLAEVLSSSGRSLPLMQGCLLSRQRTDTSASGTDPQDPVHRKEEGATEDMSNRSQVYILMRRVWFYPTHANKYICPLCVHVPKREWNVKNYTQWKAIPKTEMNENVLYQTDSRCQLITWSQFHTHLKQKSYF